VQFLETPLAGSYVIVPTILPDERGSFGRLFDATLFLERGLDATLTQASFSYNTLPGTLRGLHYQREPWSEAKLVRCTRGRVYDVMVDLRADSNTRLQWFGRELSEDTHEALYIPRGFAHGFLTLSAGAELHYQISTEYHPESATGCRWDDPAFAINWPREPAVISERDASYPMLVP
jgi:dTDP-4-dehydrorhamnose 3,5-epimerase